MPRGAGYTEQPAGTLPTRISAIVPERRLIAPLVNTNASVALAQPWKASVADPTGVVVCVEGVSVSKVPPLVKA